MEPLFSLASTITAIPRWRSCHYDKGAVISAGSTYIALWFGWKIKHVSSSPP
jgi:hypothetical protein